MGSWVGRGRGRVAAATVGLTRMLNGWQSNRRQLLIRVSLALILLAWWRWIGRLLEAILWRTTTVAVWFCHGDAVLVFVLYCDRYWPQDGTMQVRVDCVARVNLAGASFWPVQPKAMRDASLGAPVGVGG